MNLNPTMDFFYKSILDYSGMELKDNIVCNKNEKLGDVTLDSKFITLPYFENLKNPKGKIIFHILNENFVKPDTALFNLYARRLSLELNLRFSSYLISLISLCADVQMQQKVKSSKMISLISSVGEVDITVIESFLTIVKASKKVNQESFIFDIYLKKNGEVRGTPYAAIGKINFLMYNELVRALNEKDKEYRVFGAKVRKKDVLVLIEIFKLLFSYIDKKDYYTEGSDNSVFRYLDVLLRTSYLVSATLNEKASMLSELNESSLKTEDIISNLEWSEKLDELSSMQNEIRLIDNQNDISIEPPRLKETQQGPNSNFQPQPQVFDQNKAQQSIQNSQPYQLLPPQQPQLPPPGSATQRPLTPEEIVRGSLNPGQPMMMQPMMMQQPNLPVPNWIRQETMVNNRQLPQQGYPQQPMMMQPTMMQPMMQQPMMQQGYPQQNMMMQPMMQQGYPQQNMMQNPMMQQGYPQPQSGLEVNPHFLGGRNSGPWN